MSINTRHAKDYTVGVPCSDIRSKTSCAPCTREDEALAFACGIQLGGNNPLVFMQNSGFPLDAYTSLYKPYCFDFEMFVSNRQEPKHHELMGRVFPKIWETLSDEAKNCNF